jgi:hypothetical protein
MLPDSIHRAYRTTALHSVAALSLVAGLFFSTPVYAQLTMDQWRETMWAAALPMLPMSGRCYKSDFPNTMASGAMQRGAASSPGAHSRQQWIGRRLRADGLWRRRA